MTNNKPFQRFLEVQYEEGMAFAADSDVLTLQPAPVKGETGGAPEAYVASFDCTGLVFRNSAVQEDAGAVCGIHFAPDYLWNAHTGRTLAFLHPVDVFHPNIAAPHMCAFIAPGTGLCRLLKLCFELWTWGPPKNYSHGLNEQAIQWGRRQPADRFPVFNGQLQRRRDSAGDPSS